jgi:hypothetical protein
MDPMKYFLVGAAGALAPEIVRLFNIAQDGKKFTWSWFYVVVSILFAALGGLVTILLGADNARTAFFSGISTPVLINTAAKHVTRLRKSTKGAAPKFVEGRLSRFDSFVNGL